MTSNVEKRTVSLPEDHATFIDRMVASGACTSGSEVVRAALRTVKERYAAVDRWLREEVAPVYDGMQADPERARSIADVFADVREHHATRSTARSSAPTARFTRACSSRSTRPDGSARRPAIPLGHR